MGNPQVYAFATPKNTWCPIDWDENNSAFDRNWRAQGLLWINPPFNLLSEVVEKAGRDKAHCLILCPNWPTAKWWDKLQKLSIWSHYFPPGTRLFEVENGHTMSPTRWGVWIMYINPDLDSPTKIRVLKNTQLKIPISLLVEGKTVIPDCTALIDTGAEICVIRKGLVPEGQIRPAHKPLRLVGANERRLEGGIWKQHSRCPS